MSEVNQEQLNTLIQAASAKGDSEGNDTHIELLQSLLVAACSIMTAGQWNTFIKGEAAAELLGGAAMAEVSVNAMPEHVQQLANCVPIQEMAYDCISADRQDEALLHVGMLGVYLGRLSALPYMRLSNDDVSRIEHALDYQFDMTENQAEDEKNKALLKRLQGQ
jgi:hypothetical protein